MRYAVLSDIHANLEALSAVLEHLRHEDVERYLFLGDAVGYGASPNEVCDLLRPLVSQAVVGNHDAAVTGRMDYAEYYDAARRSLDWCAGQLSEENLDWLRGLPYKLSNGIADLCHGAPVEPEMFDYLLAGEQGEELLAAYDDLAPVTFIGHSHLTVSFELRRDCARLLLQPAIECDPEAKYVITVGSVGQPRDRDPRACCGVFDSDSRVFSYRRFDYDIAAARQRIIDAGLAPVFGERLLVGM